MADYTADWLAWVDSSTSRGCSGSTNYWRCSYLSVSSMVYRMEMAYGASFTKLANK